MSATPSNWRSSRWKRTQARLIPLLAYPLIGALGASLRWRVAGQEHLAAVAAAGHQPILAFWHGRILPATYFFRRRGIVVITSENFDGEWIAGIIDRFGYGTARGSSSRRALRAVRELKRALDAGRPVGFTLDGPRGPARQAQPGAIWVAKATGQPVVPFHIEAERHWTARSWDRTQVPKPFSHVALAIGSPLYVSRDADEQALEACRADLQRRLDELEGRTHAMLAARA